MTLKQETAVISQSPSESCDALRFLDSVLEIFGGGYVWDMKL